MRDIQCCWVGKCNTGYHAGVPHADPVRRERPGRTEGQGIRSVLYTRVPQELHEKTQKLKKDVYSTEKNVEIYAVFS